MRTTPLLSLVVAAAGAVVVSCGEMTDDAALPPAGVISGTLTYTGPKPCTENGRVVGSANLLLFDVRNLPPPDGLATRSTRISVIPGSKLFADIAPSLTFNADNSHWCPTANERVTVSAPFTFASVDAGRYQVRGFYDLVGDFNPAFRITIASAKGNISGGALLNASEAAAGATPIFAEVTVGAEQTDGTFVIPPSGVHLRNVAVTFGKPMAYERPYYHVSKAYYPLRSTDPTEEKRVEETPKVVEVPADWHIAYGPSEISNISDALLRLEFLATLPAADLAIAKAAPYRFRVDTGSTFDVFWDGSARVPGTKSAILADGLPAYGPSVVVSKLDVNDSRRLTGQASPRVVSSAIVSRELTLTSLLGATQGTQASDKLIALLRPTLICITDPFKNGPAHIITPFKQSLSDKPVVADEAGLTADVATLLRRDPAKTTFGEGCLIPGDYAINVVYPTSQSWTLPNESGTCFGNEQPSAVGCGTKESERKLLSSQSFLLRVGKAADPAACRAKVDARMKASCLTTDELAKLEAGTLFN